MVCISETSTSKLHTLQKRGPEGVEVLLSLYGSLRRDDAPTLGGVGMKSYYSYFAAESVATMPLGDRKKLMEHLSQEDLQKVAKNNYKTAFILCASLEKGDTALINKLKPVFQKLSQTVRKQICGDGFLQHYWGKSPGVPVSKSDFERLSQTELGSLVVLPAILAFSKIGVRPYYVEGAQWPDVRPLVEQALKNVDPNLKIARECYGTYNIDQYHEELEVANLANRLIRGEIRLSALPDEKRKAVLDKLTDNDLANLLKERELLLSRLPIKKREILLSRLPTDRRAAVLDKLPVDDLANLVDLGKAQLSELSDAKRKAVIANLTDANLANLVTRRKAQLSDVPDYRKEAVLEWLTDAVLANLVTRGEAQLSKVPADRKEGVLELLPIDKVADFITRGEARLSDLSDAKRKAVIAKLPDADLANLVKKGKIRLSALPPEKKEAVLDNLTDNDLANLVDRKKIQLSKVPADRKEGVKALLSKKPEALTPQIGEILSDALKRGGRLR